MLALLLDLLSWVTGVSAVADAACFSYCLSSQEHKVCINRLASQSKSASFTASKGRNADLTSQISIKYFMHLQHMLHQYSSDSMCEADRAEYAGTSARKSLVA